MVSKLPRPEIIPANPFSNCKLNRALYGDILTSVVKQYVDGCVLAIDGEWGIGKTTFVQMWQQTLINEGFHTLYFNVWENDFISDPIIGLVNQFRHMEQGDDVKTKYAKVVSYAGKLFSGILPALAKGVAKELVGDEVVEVIEAGAETAASSFSKLIEDYQEQCDSIEQFRSSLIDLVADVTDQGKPLVFIVDELDRCNPHYAVKVLERIKHLFSVPNIVFVLSIDKKQLCNSICGYYGSERFDAEEYLKRFIDIEYQLPEPDVDKFAAYLYDVYGFDDFFASELRGKYFRRGEEKEEFLKMAYVLFKHMHLNLRQMEKVCAHIRLALLTFKENQYVNPGLVLMLMCFRLTDRNFYNKIINGNLTAQELLNCMEDTLPRDIFIENEYNRYTVFRRAVWETARLIVAYNLDMNGRHHEDLMEKCKINDNSKEAFRLLITPKVIPQDSLLEAIKWYSEQIFGNNGVLPLCYITQHIELLTSFR